MHPGGTDFGEIRSAVMQALLWSGSGEEGEVESYQGRIHQPLSIRNIRRFFENTATGRRKWLLNTLTLCPQNLVLMCCDLCASSVKEQ